MKSITKLSAILCAAAACVAWPVMAQTSSTPAATNTAPAAPRPARGTNSYRGTIASVDAASMTLTLKVGRNGTVESKVKVTSSTKIKKDGQAATFADAVEGARVSGQGKKNEDGVWTATTMNIVTKAPAPKAPAATKPQ
jgi:hypothetical protein